MATRYFRAGVGAVLYTTDGQLPFFRRTANPAGVWQFSQGGIDSGEDAETTLWRELKEEVGLERSHINHVTPVPGFTAYRDPWPRADEPDRIGQVHQWFFLQLVPETVIDLANATEAEFDDWKWVTFTEAIEQTGDHKKHVYRQLEAFFNTEIKPKL